MGAWIYNTYWHSSVYVVDPVRIIDPVKKKVLTQYKDNPSEGIEVMQKALSVIQKCVDSKNKVVFVKNAVASSSVVDITEECKDLIK